MLGASICQATSCLLPGSSFVSASASHLCQVLPSSTGCPQLLSLGFALGTWCCIVSLECLLSLLGQFRFCSATALGWGLYGKNSVAPGWLFQETDEMQSSRLTISWSLLFIEATDSSVLPLPMDTILLPMDTIRLLTYEYCF